MAVIGRKYFTIDTTTTTYGATVYNTYANAPYYGTLTTVPQNLYQNNPINLAKLTQQIDELKDYPGVQSIVIDGLKVSVTYDQYTVLQYDSKCADWVPVTYKDFTLTIDFSHYVGDHDHGFVTPSSPNLPDLVKNVRGWCGWYSGRLGNGIATARHLEKMRLDGELISILQGIHNLFNTHPAQAAFF